MASGGGVIIVVRIKVTSRPEKTDEVVAALAEVVAPSREVAGVISFDVGRDVTDPNTFVATEVFEDAAARERQESIPQVGKVMTLLPESLAAPPEATVYHVSSSEPAMG
jgi:quinol monooxygenase YgiN